jgi:hypothetical protein
MKKLLAFLMVCSFAMAFVACGGGAKTDEATEEETPTPTEEVAPEPAPDTTTVSSDSTSM